MYVRMLLHRLPDGDDEKNKSDVFSITAVAPFSLWVVRYYTITSVWDVLHSADSVVANNDVSPPTPRIGMGLLHNPLAATIDPPE